MKFNVTNKCKDISANDLLRLCRALDAQQEQVALDWGWRKWPVHYGLPTGMPVYLLPGKAPEAGTLAYHDIDDKGQPFANVYWGEVKAGGGQLLQGAMSLAATVSHEICETRGDYLCSFWADMGKGVETALELCDAVEDQAYEINGVAVSNYLLPAWFDAAAKGPYDRMKRLAKPLSRSEGGYLILRNDGEVSQDFGSQYPEARKNWKTRLGRRAT